MEHLPGPTEQPRVVRKQLWIHSDKNALMPKCRLWLDGAVCYAAGLSGSEAVVVGCLGTGWAL
jgi:hypothetical protein